MIKIELEIGAHAPTYGSEYAAGADLYANESFEILPGHRALIKTGVRMEIPSGFYGRIAPRSGLAYKNGIDVMAGVIDSDYRGDIGVILINLGETDFTIQTGDRIAQMIIEKYYRYPFCVVESLEETTRGDNGFGSTGK